jgi:AcrR family transcriptional regulator
MTETSSLRSDAQANRARLLDAARAVFAEYGIESEMKVISERAGVGVGTIYRNFATKADLLAAIVNEAIEDLSRALDAAIQQPDAAEAIATFIRGTLTVVENSGEIARMMLEEALPAACLEAFQRADLQRRLTELVERGKAQGVFRPDLHSGAAAAVLHTIMVPGPYLQLRKELSLDEIADAYTSLVLSGMLKQ